MRAVDVFTPGRYPSHTYVDDHLAAAKEALNDALEAGSTLVSISGPSKSGKTVFVENAIGKDRLIIVTGAGVDSADSLWLRVFDSIGTSVARTSRHATSKSGLVNVEAQAEGGIPLVAKGSAGVALEATRGTESETAETAAIDYLQLLIKEFVGSGFVVFIDDFHYVSRSVQIDLAKQIKEAIRRDVKIICASVPYHSDDVLRGNPDLRGRVSGIDFDYWKNDVLQKIAHIGFALLNIRFEPSVVLRFAAEAAGSPQLMQALCLQACFELDVRETAPHEVTLSNDQDQFERICRRTVAMADYGSIVDKMKEGPKTRGSDRKVYITRFGWQGDVYKLLAKALSLDPPRLTFRYGELMERIKNVGTGEEPSGSSMTNACFHAAQIVNDANGQKIVEWDADNDVFDITDPYFLFYLRWSDAVG